jgi:aspartate/methionine/tyrosine aminotransferase
MVIEDLAYEFITYNNNKMNYFYNIDDDTKSRTIAIFTSGKMFSCVGWRIGWVLYLLYISFKFNYNNN